MWAGNLLVDPGAATDPALRLLKNNQELQIRRTNWCVRYDRHVSDWLTHTQREALPVG